MCEWTRQAVPDKVGRRAKKNPKHAPYAKKLYLCTRKKEKNSITFFINIKKLRFYEKKS